MATVSAETSKKISEALKKYWATRSAPDFVPPKSEEGKKLFEQYDRSMKSSTDLEGQRNSLTAQLKTIKRGKAGTAARNKIKAQLSAITEKLKTERNARTALRAQANQQKRAAKAKEYLGKIEAKRKQVDALEVRLKTAISQAKKPEAAERLRQSLARLTDVRARMAVSEKTANDTISGKVNKETSVFDFGEAYDAIELAGPLWRPYTMYEDKAVMQFLAEQFDDQEAATMDDFDRLYQEQVVPALEGMQRRISAGDIAAIILFFLLRPKAVRDIVNKAQTWAYETGKKSGINELVNAELERKKAEADKPKSEQIKPVAVNKEVPTPALDRSLNAFERDAIADAMAQDINDDAKTTILEGLAKGVGAAAIIAAVRERTKAKFDQLAKNVAGTVVTENVNRGRRAAFNANGPIIAAYQRSEILDAVTCAMCISLDKRVIKADDPMAKMDTVHSNCRGLWVPITEGEAYAASTLPKTIVDNFKTVGGVPVTNSFTQLKRPLPKRGNEDALAIARERAAARKKKVAAARKKARQS